MLVDSLFIASLDWSEKTTHGNFDDPSTVIHHDSIINER